MNKALQVLFDRGFVKDCTNIDGLSDLMDKEPVTFYCGTDPTGPSLHVGHIVPFFAMHHLQQFGHKPLALVGGGTGLIGDPSGKTEMRKILPAETIAENAERIAKQLAKVVNFDEVPPAGYGQGRIVNNADWLVDLNYIEFLRDVGKYFSVNRMLTFEGVKQRLERGLSFIEFNYQLLQSYDYHMLYSKYNNRLQIGGADQWGNIVAGIDLIQRMGGPECFGLTFNLIMRADGKKMGKSEKGAVFLDPDLYSPYDFYQYWRNIADADAIKFMKLFTFMDLDEVAEYADPKRNINDAKAKLAYEVTKIIHGEEEAEKALAGAKAAFSGAGDRSNMPTVEIEFGEGKGVIDLFFEAGLAGTKSDVRRLIQGGGCSIDDKKVTDVKAVVTKDDATDGEMILRAGKKHFKRVIVK
ncbi:MAG TPA: tyrosine--tRNA ligase [Sphaerochaeta sp.]|jgi:tyrosyl-tRNA synthetase|nr:tyrosine--tRNA ligase [Sphaerochaeta sp.]